MLKLLNFVLISILFLPVVLFAKNLYPDLVVINKNNHLRKIHKIFSDGRIQVRPLNEGTAYDTDRIYSSSELSPSVSELDQFRLDDTVILKDHQETQGLNKIQIYKISKLFADGRVYLVCNQNFLYGQVKHISQISKKVLAKSGISADQYIVYEGISFHVDMVFDNGLALVQNETKNHLENLWKSRFLLYKDQIDMLDDHFYLFKVLKISKFSAEVPSLGRFERGMSVLTPDNIKAEVMRVFENGLILVEYYRSIQYGDKIHGDNTIKFHEFHTIPANKLKIIHQ